MTWLFTQVWFLMFAAFLAGAVATYFVLSRLLPHVDRVQSELLDQDGEH